MFDEVEHEDRTINRYTSFKRRKRPYSRRCKIPYEYGLDGHSDADVLVHAISECILGALALGDLGSHFPDTDPRYRGISSILLLEEVKRKCLDTNIGLGISMLRF